MQWSRRFIGLKVFMSLAALGAEGYEKLVEHQAAMGDLLRDELQRAGFRVVNETPLPVVCFTHEKIEAGAPAPRTVVDRVNGSGRAWISEVLLSGERKALRACITSYRTGPEDVGILIGELERALAAV
jgi:glutamate/tyrosine decarboxylase-like PLP-dependent enzyme